MRIWICRAYRGTVDISILVDTPSFLFNTAYFMYAFCASLYVQCYLICLAQLNKVEGIVKVSFFSFPSYNFVNMFTHCTMFVALKFQN